MDRGSVPEIEDGIPVGGCIRCRHLLKAGGLDGEGWTCKAFPNGIAPDVVLSDGETHIEHLSYDNGYKYDPEPFEFAGEMWVRDWYGVPIKVGTR